jgi:hypothetical protein
VGLCPSPTPGTWSTFHPASQLTGHPTAIEVSLLRGDLLVVNEALPGHAAGVEAEVVFYGLERRRWRLIRPNLASDGLVGLGVGQGMISGTTLPLAERSAVGDLVELERG